MTFKGGVSQNQIKLMKKSSRQLNNLVANNLMRRNKTPLLVNATATQGSFNQSNRLNVDLEEQQGPRFTKAMIQDLIDPVKRITGSRIFGENLDDYQILASKLGNYKLSRVRANELNIYCRGGVSGVKAHISQLRLSQQTKKAILSRDASQNNRSRQTLVESVLSNNKSSLPSISKPLDTIGASGGTTDNQNFKPPIDFELLADWFNQNAYSIINVNHLRTRKNNNSALRDRYRG